MIRLAWKIAQLVGFIPTALFAQFAFHDSLNGIYWAQVEPPSSENFYYCQILDEGLGYVVSFNSILYEYDASRPRPWRRMPNPNPYHTIKYYALAPDDIWAVAELPEQYKQIPYHWNGRRWLAIDSPNVYNIRDFLFASPEEGWFACEYGELWHYFRGQWQQEELPLFIHVNRLLSTADGALYAHCEAPDQSAILRRWQGNWQVLPIEPGIEPITIVLSPSGLLLIGGPDFPQKTIHFDGQTAKLLPVEKLQYFNTMAGYGINRRTIYAFQDTAYVKVAESPKQLSDICLFNERFSWMIGDDGLILVPQRTPAVQRPQVERVFDFKEHDLSHLYGMAALQQRPGKSSLLYLVQTGAPNLIYESTSLSRLQTTRADHARRLNLAGFEKYADRQDGVGQRLINYDQAVATGDLNGDGLEDVIVTSMYGYPQVYFNSGHDYYFDATSYSGLKHWGSAQHRPMLANLFDADLDGDLDLFIACQYRSDAFFVNDGRGRFEEATEAAGLSTEGGGIGGFAADFDGDGREDLYVTRVNRPNLLYRNLGPDSLTGLPRFANVSEESGEACWPSLKQSQGVAIADYDNDGDFDLFVCNLLEGNRLLQNDGAGGFRDVTSQAGLVSHEQSTGASFFDADHDGDLDLVVANKGFDLLYRNSGDGTFTESSELLGGAQFRYNLIMHGSRQYGGNSSGTLVLDWDADFDLDVLISNYDTGLFVFQNNLDTPLSAIRIFPEGVVSNRSAIGAKVLLFESGKMDDPAALAGTRLIESANSYGCSPAKVAHFGVEAEKRYDARIIFPSGIVREIRGLRGGDRAVVAELEGLAASAIKARRTLANLLAGYRSRERYLVLGAGLLWLVIGLFVSKRYLGMSAYDRKRLAAIFGFSLLSCLFLWFAHSQTEFILRPLILSAGVTGMAILVLRAKRLYQARAASLEMLQVRLNAFGHGSLIHQLMNRLAFYAENLETGAKLPAAGRAKILEAVAGLLHFLNHEIRAILRYQYGNNFAMDLAFRLETVWSALRKTLIRMRQELTGRKEPAGNTLKEAVSLQRQIKESVADIQQRLSHEFLCDASTVVADLVRNIDHEGIRFGDTSGLPPARITAADLAYVLDELVQNALRNIDGTTAQITISVRQSLDELYVDVRDNGRGIPPDLWEEIFRPGFTSKPAGKGGFGLYHARQRVSKHGGKIFVAASEKGKGTTMRVCLRTV